MNPIPPRVLLGLVLALCGLCAWQWHREVELRHLLRDELLKSRVLLSERTDLEVRVKAADAEIVRLTGSLAQWQADSVSREEAAAGAAEAAGMRTTLERQHATIGLQNERLMEAGTSIEEANATIRRLTSERDGLATRLNEVTEKYNALRRRATR